MRCLFCGSENKDTAKFCVRCGKRVPRCPTCGNVILSRARFCKYDGTRIPEEILISFPEAETPKESSPVAPVPPIVPQEPVAEPEPIVVPEPIAEPVVVPMPVEEPEPIVIPAPVVEPEELPVSYCVKCGAVCTDGMKLCPKCRREAAPRPAVRENFCVRCGAPCEPNQKLCPDCREREAAGRKNKRMSGLVIILLVLLLITAAVAGVLIWRELSRGDEPTPSTPTTQAWEEITEAPTTAPTTVPTTAPTEPTVPATPLDFWVENCDSQYLLMADLLTFDAETCRLARNAIFARSGRIFKDEALQTYFNQFDWYVPRIDPDSFTNNMLNEYQLYNLDLILAYEESCGYR